MLQDPLQANLRRGSLSTASQWANPFQKTKKSSLSLMKRRKKMFEEMTHFDLNLMSISSNFLRV
jgi:hypothetical protein